MNDFKFNGDWETDLYLDKLSLLSNDKFFRGSHKGKLSKGLVPVRINEAYNLLPDPLPSQLLAIQYIQENQSTLLEGIFDRVINHEYPLFKTLIDEEEAWFPPLETLSDLENAVGILEVNILNLEKEGYAYYTINFTCTWENEHGFSILFHKDRILKSDEGWVYDIEAICAENGVDYEKYGNDSMHWDDEIFDFITPNAKYGKLKPIEISSNESLPFRLICMKKGRILIDFIKEGKVDINFNYTGEGSCNSLLANAVAAQDEQLVAFLISNNIRNFGSALNAAKYIDHPGIISRITAYYEASKEWLWVS